MEFSLQFQEIAVLGLLCATICFWVVVASGKGNKNKARRPPEPSGAWPIIGHLHLLGANKLLHRTFGAMADEYGPAFSIRLGIRQTLVISSWEVARECFTTNDRVFPTRPKSLAVKLMGYNQSLFGFAPYGPYWRDVRKLAMVELLSNRRLEMLKHVRDSEVNFFIKELYEQWKGRESGSLVPVEMKERFGDLAMNIIVRMVAGKRYFGTGACSNNAVESRRCQKAMGDFMHLVGGFMVSDAFPCLGWLDVVNGYKGEMKRTAKEVDCLFGSWLEEHRRRRLTGSINEDEQDFIHVMLSVMDDGQFSGHDADTVIKATCLSLILGGNDTTVVTLTWVLSLLLNNRHVLKKAQDELDIHVGKHRQVDESDIKNLVYLQATLKETLRLYPALPLSAPREAMKDCMIAGFDVPAGTQLSVNLWKLLRDPSIWSDPSEFQPERFLTDHAHFDIRGQDFEYIPFGSGRRMCPGVSFAQQVLHLTLARLLHSFKFGTISDLPVDMTESPGLTVPKATPLEVVLAPRLPSELYGY